MIEQHRNPDGTINGVGVMSDLTGLSQSAIEYIWNDVKANHAKLNACPSHDFDQPQPGQRQRKCKACGGTVGMLEARWYELGLRHGAAKGANEDDWK